MFGHRRPRWSIVVVLLIALHAMLGEAVGQFAPQDVARSTSGRRPRRPASRSDLSEHDRYMLEDAALTDVCFADAQNGWAVGDRGAIWHTADGGRNWRRQSAVGACRPENEDGT